MKKNEIVEVEITDLSYEAMGAAMLMAKRSLSTTPCRVKWSRRRF